MIETMLFKLLDKENRVYLYFIIAIILLLAVGTFYEFFIPAGDTGKIVISHLDENTSIILDEQEERRIDKPEDNVTIRRVTSGTHSILISRDGYWPWLKESVEVRKGESSVISPFFIPANTNGFLIGESDPEYQEIISKINSTTLPSFEDKLLSEDGFVAIWVDGSTLFAEWQGDETDRPEYFCNEFGCHNVIVPFGAGLIRNVDFYKNRNDVFIVGFGKGVYAVEVDHFGFQNFQPIFEGNDGATPEFIANDNSSIYILGDSLMQVAI